MHGFEYSFVAPTSLSKTVHHILQDLAALCELAFVSLVKQVSILVNIGAVRQQAITWAKVDPDLCCHMASLDHNGLKKGHCRFGW